MTLPICRSSLLLMTLAIAPSAEAQCLADRFDASDTSQFDHFGAAVAASGTDIVVGAPFDDYQTTGADGSMTVFRQGATSLIELQKLDVPGAQPGDYWGWEAAFAGNTIAGTARYGDGAAADDGVVHLFERAHADAPFVHTAALFDPLGSSIFQFGESLDLVVVGSLRRLAVGSPQHIGTSGNSEGRVWVYESDAGGPWTLTQGLDPNPPTLQAEMHFGVDLSMAGDWMFVGASGWQDTGGLAVGAVQIFRSVGGSYVFHSQLVSPNPADLGFFGFGLDSSHPRLAVGAFGESLAPGPLATGAVHVFRYIALADSWSWEDSVTGSDSLGDDEFGRHVSLETDTLLVGADDKGLGTPGGALGGAYLFELASSSWNEVALFDPQPNGATLGREVCLEGSTYLICDEAFDGGGSQQGGVVYFGQFAGDDCDSDGTFDLCQAYADPSLDLDANKVLDSCQCVAVQYCSSLPNSTGSTSTLSGTGSLSVADNTFGITASSMPNQFGIFFYGATQVSLPFGDGIRCVGGPFFRSSPAQAANNSLSLTLDFTSPFQPAGQVLPFSTWNFQTWFRDPAALGAGFNTSNAISVTFCP